MATYSVDDRLLLIAGLAVLCAAMMGDHLFTGRNRQRCARGTLLARHQATAAVTAPLTRRLVLTIVALAAGLLVSACTGAPDRTAEAERLKSTVEAMPGVTDLSMSYHNDIVQGTILDLHVSMEDATEPQIADVATKINELRGNLFDEYDRTLKISVAQFASVSPGTEYDPIAVARTASLVRALHQQVQTRIEWYGTIVGDTSSLKIFAAQAPGEALDAALRLLDGRRADIEVSPAEGTSLPYWSVSGPLTPEGKQRIDHQLSALPGPASWVGVKDGFVTQLTLVIPSEATAYQDLVSTIKAVDGGPQHPIILRWVLAGDAATRDELRWAGIALIGACGYNKNDTTATKGLTADAQLLQQRIRREFDTCPK